ncbi:MAG TPA: hypothetical protein PKX15_01030 [Bacteroidales bacterium]|nr:hypothetical protein [Bacteroidales bacterium]
MIQKFVINSKTGKKYVVNCPGWNDGVGPGAPAGTLWMKSQTDDNWYEINVSGPYNSVDVYINPTSIGWESNDLGFQLLYNLTDGKIYQIYLTGTGAGTSIVINQTPWVVESDYKPYLLLKSITNGLFHRAYLSGNAGSVILLVDQNGIQTDKL